MKYLFDANVFITAKNTYYAMDIVKSFWVELEQNIINHKVLVIDKVYDELVKGKDELAEWVKKIFYKKTISSNSSRIIANYNQIIESVTNNDTYTQQAKNEFARVADSWLIAHAYQNYSYEDDCCIVTNEKYDTNIKRKVKIPNICRLFNINYIDLFQFMRTEKINI